MNKVLVSKNYRIEVSAAEFKNILKYDSNTIKTRKQPLWEQLELFGCFHIGYGEHSSPSIFFSLNEEEDTELTWKQISTCIIIAIR